MQGQARYASSTLGTLSTDGPTPSAPLLAICRRALTCMSIQRSTFPLPKGELCRNLLPQQSCPPRRQRSCDTLVKKEFVGSPQRGRHRISSPCFRRHRGRGPPARKQKKKIIKWYCVLTIQMHENVFLLHGHEHHLGEKARGELGPSLPKASSFPHQVTSTGTAQVTTAALAEASPELSSAARNKCPR